MAVSGDRCGYGQGEAVASDRVRPRGSDHRGKRADDRHQKFLAGSGDRLGYGHPGRVEAHRGDEPGRGAPDRVTGDRLGYGHRGRVDAYRGDEPGRGAPDRVTGDRLGYGHRGRVASHRGKCADDRTQNLAADELSRRPSLEIVRM